MGLVLAAGMAALTVRGTDGALRGALGLMAAATLIDATDGWLARRLEVGTRLPAFDGRRLDDIVDFHTYVSLPLLLVWRAGLLPGGLGWVLLAPLLASAYGFSRREAKTADGFFLGFPSYWNVVAFYLWFLRPDPWVAAVLLLVLAALVPLPWKYLNAARPGPLRRTTLALAAVWGAVLVAVLAGVARKPAWVWGSLAFPAYYLAASWLVTARDRRRRRRRAG